MTIKKRTRISTDEDIRKAKERLGRPKLHKISLFVPVEHIKKMKLRAVEEETTLTEMFQKLVKDYVEN